MIQNKIVHFFVFKSGKWSMADVIVVAIFMSYIGFQGIISSQLNNLSETSDNIKIITTNATELQVGFVIFTSFSLMSIMLSGLIAGFHNQKLFN